MRGLNQTGSTGVISRAFGAAPLADAVMMVIFVRAGKRRFPRRN